MKYYIEEPLEKFNAWSGAKDTLATLIEFDDCELVETMLEEYNEECGGLSETDVNDILWHESDDIATWLGYENWEDYCKNRKNDKQ